MFVVFLSVGYVLPVLFHLLDSGCCRDGVNTSARCLANSSTFSASLLALGPGGVEFLGIGGSCVRAFFLDLSGFRWSYRRV